MLKKTIFLTLLLSFSSFSFATKFDSKLTVTPDKPEEWGYWYATVKVNDQEPIFVSNGRTISVSIPSNISLTVYAMNTRPRLDDSCQNIQILEEGAHQLLFKLEPDWLVHCRYT